MKSYDETARTVLDRVHAYERAQVRRRTAMVRGAATLCCLGIVFGLGFLFLRHGDGFRPQHVISGTDTSHTDPTDNTTNTDMTTDSNPTDTNVTDTEGGQTTSTDIPPLTFPFEGSSYFVDASKDVAQPAPLSMFYVGGGSDGAERSEAVIKALSKIKRAEDDPRVEEVVSAHVVEGFQALEGKLQLSLQMNNVEFPLRYAKTLSTVMANCPYESLKSTGLVDRYLGTWQGEWLSVEINRETGVLTNYFMSLSRHPDLLKGDVSEEEAKQIAIQTITKFYGSEILEEIPYHQTFDTLIQSELGYRIEFRRMYGEYRTEESIFVTVSKGGIVKSVVTYAFGHYANIDSTLTLDRVRAAEQQLKDSLGVGKYTLSKIVRDGDGNYLLHFYADENSFWLTIP